MTKPTYDRERAETLNADHHRRMAAAAPNAAPNVATLDHRSRANLVNAILGCMRRHDMVPSMPGAPKLLELGAGYGGDHDYLVERLGCRYVGIELVESVAEAAPEYVTHMPLEEAPEDWNGRFRFIYSRHVMEHAIDVDLACQTVRRLLAPNGIVGAVTPHYFPDPEPAHVSQLRIEQWQKAYERNGLKAVYAVVENHACTEAHLVCVHKDWPLQP